MELGSQIISLYHFIICWISPAYICNIRSANWSSVDSVTCAVTFQCTFPNISSVIKLASQIVIIIFVSANKCVFCCQKHSLVKSILQTDSLFRRQLLMSIVMLMKNWYLFFYVGNWKFYIEHISVIFTAIGVTHGFWVIASVLSCLLQSCQAG